MAKVEGVSKVQAKLKAKEAETKNASVVVGYTTAYAIHVHENLRSYHPVGNAKFLEGPARRMSKQLGDMVKAAYAKNTPLPQCLLLAGLALQRESQKEVPVDTGALKNSAFTRLEEKEK